MKKFRIAVGLTFFLIGMIFNVSFASPQEAKQVFEKNPFSLNSRTFSFTVPAGVTPSVKVTIWGYEGSPKNRSIRKTNSCSIYPIKGQAPGVFGARMTDNLCLTEFNLKWKTGKPAFDGKQKSVLSPDIKLGGTVKFTFQRGSDTFVTEIAVANESENPFEYNDAKTCPLTTVVEGLAFTLSDKELRSRKVFNKRINTFASTTEWKVNGSSFDEAFANKTMPSGSFQDYSTTAVSASSESIPSGPAGIQSADGKSSRPTQAKARFTRAVDGIITDASTKLHWKEGPDKDLTWDEAQTWINSLGKGWRTPTRAELAKLYISDLTTVNRIDPVFRQVRFVWAELQAEDSHKAWTYYFDSNNEGWRYRDTTYQTLRAFAVRSRP